MIDMVWAVSMSVCAVVLLTVTVYFRKKNRAEQEAEEKERKQRHDAAVAKSLTGGTGGTKLQLSAEEIQRDLDRLCLLFSHSTETARKTETPKTPTEAVKRPTAPKTAVVSQKPAEAPKLAIVPQKPAEAPKPAVVPQKPAEAPKPAVVPHKHAEAPKRLAVPLKTELKAKPESPPKGKEDIQSEIEQAVKETP